MDYANGQGNQTLSSSAANHDAGLVELFAGIRTESGRTLLSLLDEQPMLLVFLRHFGCASAREAIADIGKARPELERRGVRPVFVHMATPARARSFFSKPAVSDLERVSDPETAIYQAPVFHLLKTTVLPEFFSATQLTKLAKRAVWRYGVGSAGKEEDATQLPGVFFIKDRHIKRAFRHKGVADRPDYELFGV